MKIFAIIVLLFASPGLFGQQGIAGIFEVTYLHPQPIISQRHKGVKSNIYGFEGGRAIKLKDGYHLFTTELNGKPVWTVTRLAHWKSKDGINWQRVSTLFTSTGNFDGTDTHAALWSPMPVYDSASGYWLLTFVCYRSKPNTKDNWYRNYDGRIALAKSTVKGDTGINGPYIETAIIMESDTSSPKFGIMGIDSFSPYLLNDGWYSFYGSSPEWNGLVKSGSINGPWTRLTKPGMVSEHTENPIVTKLEDGRYVAFFDGCGVYQRFGYLLSADGKNWEKPVIIDLDNHTGKWWGLTRTPLGLIGEGNGNYTLYFTAYNKNFYTIPGIWSAGTDDVFDGFFASVGMMKLKLKK